MHRIVYDYQTFALQQYGGVSRYFCELAARVHRSDGFSAHVVAPLHVNDHLGSCAVARTGLRLPPGVLRGRVLREINQLVSPVLITAQRPTLIHRTYYHRMPGGRRPCPEIVTVFDMIHELFPEEFMPNDPTSENKRRAVDAAARVLCISENTAQDLIRIFQVPAEKISVTPLGFSDAFASVGSDARGAPHPRPYLLYVGQRGGYKNFEVALRALAASSRLRSEFDLLLFGGLDLSEGEVELAVALGLRRDQLRRVSGSDADLAQAYRHARVFVYPSKYEGFGIPPLEAMSCGCPVVCSDTSSIPEVVGESAILFDPYQVESLCAALERVCFDEQFRQRLVDAGRERTKHFTWDRCAKDTIEAYRLACA